MIRTKHPTHAHLILTALAHLPQDFASTQDLINATGSSYNQATAALFHLRKRGAIDVVIEHDGTAWWFATPGSDDRTRTLEERTPEEQPRNRRRTRITKVTP